MAEQFTEEEAAKYVELGGTACPKCGNHMLMGSIVQVKSGQAWQDITCDDCEIVFRDLYKLIGVEVL